MVYCAKVWLDTELLLSRQMANSPIPFAYNVFLGHLFPWYTLFYEVHAIDQDQFPYFV